MRVDGSRTTDFAGKAAGARYPQTKLQAALEMIDALGFKGIWRGADANDAGRAERVLDNMRSLERGVHRPFGGMFVTAEHRASLAIDPANLMALATTTFLSDSLA